MLRSVTTLIILIIASLGRASDSPNFLVILTDDLGFSDLGCYGATEIETPHLDSLASNGLRFTQFYNTGRCWPTRASLLTGYYPHEIGRDALPRQKGSKAKAGNRSPRPQWAPLIPTYLKPAGYRCYHSGKWHIDGMPVAQGFDKSRYVNNQGTFFSERKNYIDDTLVPPESTPAGYYATTATAQHAIDCLKDHASHFSAAPFFQYVAFIAPHFPLHAIPDHIDRYLDKYLKGWYALRSTRHARQTQLDLLDTELSTMERNQEPPYHFPSAFETLGDAEVRLPSEWDQLTESQQLFQATKMAIHAAMVYRVDQEIGRIIEQLKIMGELDNTVILFASDNGCSAEIMVRDGGHDPAAPMGSEDTYLCLGPGFSSACNTPFRKHKTWMHEGGIATPLIVHWPDGFKAKGELRETPGHVIDIVPTLLSLAGIEPKLTFPFSGENLAPLFQSDQDLDREPLWWRHEGNRAIRVGNWKLVAENHGNRNQDGPWELYDLSVDRAEQNDLSSAHPEKVAELNALWEKQASLMRQRLEK
ncbi:MAG: arylsulfatase [Verrucomicrobiota bacterium]